MADALQLARISKRIRSIPDFTVPEVPKLPDAFVRQFRLEEFSSEWERWRQNTQNGLKEALAATKELNDLFLFGTGSPEGVVSATPGKIYLNLTGGAGTTLWVKETGSEASGWIAK